VARRVALLDLLAAHHPDEDARELVASGRVQVNGSIVVNERALVDPACRLVVSPSRTLKGERKLAAALDALAAVDVAAAVDVGGAVCVDVGASTGGFTTALLARGARRVYAVDVGHGQLTGKLRQDARVVNLETVNAASLSGALVPDVVDVVTIDVSYTALAVIVPQVTNGLAAVLSPSCALLALVKPMFELSLGSLPTDDESVARAVDLAASAARDSGWDVARTFRSPLLGNNGAVEWWLSARLAPS